jgi:hypothetical protein
MSTTSPSSATPSQPAAPDAAAARHLFQAAAGYMLSAALHAAARFDIAERLLGGPRHVADLAAEAGVREDSLYRVLRALSSAGIFTEASPRTFALTPAAALLRKGAHGLGDGIEFITDTPHFRVYGELAHTLLTGTPAGEKVFGMPLFEYLPRDPAWARSFNDAMTAFSASVMPAVLQAYSFDGIDVLVDVAGGHGYVLTSVLREYPSMRGILFDADHVVAGAGPLIARAGVEGRCRTEAGDFFAGVPQGGDAYIMKNIVHDWDDDRAVVILGHIRQALAGRRGGRVILLEAVIPPGDEPHLSKLIDLEMMLMPGGRERTADEFAALFARAGLALARVVPTESLLSVVEARLP